MADDDERGGGSLLSALAHPQILNPLAAYQGAAETANSIWRTREWKARQAAGEAFQGSINPDGTTNQPGLNRRLAADPAAALAAAAMSQTGLTNAGGEQEQTVKRMGIMTGLAAPLLASGQPISKQQWIDTMMGGLGSHGYSREQVMQAAAHIPEPTAQNPFAVNDWLRGHVTSFINPEQRTTAFGTPQTTNTGDQIITRNVPSIPPNATGALPPGQTAPPLAPGLTPAEKTETQPAIDPATGAPGIVPKGSKFNPDGSLKPPGWGNSGKYPTPGAPATPTAPAGFTPTGQAPGLAEAQRQEAEASTRAGTKIYADADAATTMKSQLLTMESDLARISTGPTSERAATVNAFLQKYGLPSGMTAEEIASSEGFAKIAKQIALAQAGALGAGTDEKLTTSMGANPNRDLSKLGNQQILAMLQGNADAIKARGVAYDQWKQTHPGAATNSFLTDFNKTFDPRVYQWGYQIKTMTGPQRAAAYDALPDKAEFRRKYNAAVAAKLIDPNGY